MKPLSLQILRESPAAKPKLPLSCIVCGDIVQDLEKAPDGWEVEWNTYSERYYHTCPACS